MDSWNQANAIAMHAREHEEGWQKTRDNENKVAEAKIKLK